MIVFYGDASAADRVASGELAPTIPVRAGPDGSGPLGVAYARGSLPGPAGESGEAAWRLVVGGRILPGCFALRGGVFPEAEGRAGPAGVT